MKRIAIIGGGAAGFFLAINLKEMAPSTDVVIFERSSRVLSKVAVSGGGRCNCTNSFASVSDLSQVYPRGHRLLKRLFNIFDYRDAYQWFERHGVPLTVQDDECVFPKAQDSQVIIDCFLSEARRHDIQILTNHPIVSLDSLLGQYDGVVVTTGGSPRIEGLEWLRRLDHRVEPPVPSLFTFSIADPQLRSLMGIVAPQAVVQLPGTRYRAEGPLLITHWGMSGPAVLKLSSHAARHLADNHYQSPLCVNWVHSHEQEVREQLSAICRAHGQQTVAAHPLFGLSQRLWSLLLERAIAQKAGARWNELSHKDLNRLVSVLTADVYTISGRAAFKEEFVTCGGISLASVKPQTLESRSCPGLFFAGEILDIDGVTGGFNFQAAWTTAFTVAKAIAES